MGLTIKILIFVVSTNYVSSVVYKIHLPRWFTARPILLGGFVFGWGVLLLRTANSWMPCQPVDVAGTREQGDKKQIIER